MSQLCFDDPTVTEAYATMLAAHGVALPLRLCHEHLGSVIDAEGLEVFVVDVNNENSDGHTCGIAHLLVHAVNTLGGFRPELANG